MKKILSYCLLGIIMLSAPLAAYPVVKVLFSPNDKPTTALVELINASTKRIYAAVYFLTDKTIAQALIDAKKRKVDVKIILDPISNASFGQAKTLHTGNVPVFVYNNKLKPGTRLSKEITLPTQRVIASEGQLVFEETASTSRWFNTGPIMHNKYAIFDSKTLWTGSFNWTGAANTKNQENVIIVQDIAISKLYEDHFMQLLESKTEAYKPAPLEPVRKKAPSLRQKVYMALEQYGHNDSALLSQLASLMTKQTNVAS